MVSVATAIKEKMECKVINWFNYKNTKFYCINYFQDLDLHIKWPNDLYANKNTKIGGVLVNSAVQGNIAIVNIGKAKTLFLFLN